MAEKNPRKNPTTDALFDAILSLETCLLYTSDAADEG